MRILAFLLNTYALLILLVIVTPVLAGMRPFPATENNTTTRSNGLADVDLKAAQSLFERGQVHQKQRKFALAERNYKKSIAAVEKSAGEYHPVLITYLRKLGSLYFQMAQYDQSLHQFQRASISFIDIRVFTVPCS